MRQEWHGRGIRVMDYRSYRLDWKENILWFLAVLSFSGMVSWLFYRSVYGMAVALPLLILTRRFFRNYLLKRRKREMLYRFGEILQMASASLKAGSSLENAFLQADSDYRKLYGDKDTIAQEFQGICCRMKLNEPLELLVEDFAQRSGIEEMVSFAQVISFAKRGGGDMVKIFQNTVEKIRQKSDVEREIATVVTAKKTEQRIMDLTPFAILAYVGITSPEFLEPLYGSPFGICVMTCCLSIYAGAFLLAEKILDIQI